MKALKGKKDIDKLFEGEWEGVCHVLWDGMEEMDKNTRNYFVRKIEAAIWMIQNIEQARGGKPNQFWDEGGCDPKAFWAEWDRWRAQFEHFIDPETAKWERAQKKRDLAEARELARLRKLDLTGKRIRVKEGTRKSPLSDEDALFDCDGMCLKKGKKRPVLSLMDIEAGAEGTIGALVEVTRGKLYEVIWDDGEQEDFSYTKARGAYPLAQILAGAEIL